MFSPAIPGRRRRGGEKVVRGGLRTTASAAIGVSVDAYTSTQTPRCHRIMCRFACTSGVLNVTCSVTQQVVQEIGESVQTQLNETGATLCDAIQPTKTVSEARQWMALRPLPDHDLRWFCEQNRRPVSHY